MNELRGILEEQLKWLNGHVLDVHTKVFDALAELGSGKFKLPYATTNGADALLDEALVSLHRCEASKKQVGHNLVAIG